MRFSIETKIKTFYKSMYEKHIISLWNGRVVKACWARYKDIIGPDTNPP
jgi:hypothetical protein